MEKTIKCSFCDETFATFEAVSAHERNRHRKRIKALLDEITANVETKTNKDSP